MIKTFFNDAWYGEINRYQTYLSENNEETTLARLLCQFQHGDFSEKQSLVDLVQMTKDPLLRKVGLRLFISIASHKDFSLLGLLFDETNEKEVENLCYFAESGMSLQCIPYLLALLEIWEGTMQGEVICYTIGYMIKYLPAQDNACSLKQVSMACEKFISTHNPESYYYSGKEAFIGDLSKSFLTSVMYYKTNSKPYIADDVPSILSVNTGIKCSIEHGCIIDDNKLQEAMMYVQSMANGNWKHGCKYFYGHVV